MPPVIRPAIETEYAAVRHVVRAAFGQDAEADLVEALRREGQVRLERVAESGGQVVGHVLYSALEIVGPDQTWPALALAPLAVLPEFQSQGIGTALVEHAHTACRQAGHQIVIVLGHPAYYPRFGFSPQLAERLDSPYAGPSFMALELSPGALAGVSGQVVYAPPFSRF
ncbi:MAG: GNAT family N-acetyltransferase [Pirellulales bacterium]